MVRYKHEPTIGLIELSSIARGIDVTDRVLKEAAVSVLVARPVSPGKYVILFTGGVEDVQSSMRAGTEAAASSLVDRLLLPAVHDGVLTALDRPVRVPELDAVGVIETFTVASTLLAADVAAKKAAVTLIEVHLACGIGGKSYVTLTGPIGDVDASVSAGAGAAAENDLLLARVVIPRPHESMRDRLGRHGEEI